MKDYVVTVHFSGSKTYLVSAPSDDEAEYSAQDEFDNDIGDLSDYTEVTDVETQLDSDE
jgi:hypothetical protein